MYTARHKRVHTLPQTVSLDVVMVQITPYDIYGLSFPREQRSEPPSRLMIQAPYLLLHSNSLWTAKGGRQS